MIAREKQRELDILNIRGSRFITIDPDTRRVVENAKRIAAHLDKRPADQFASVLIIGPSGCGKELLAQILHGRKPDNLFKSTNCAGFTDTLFESLLFGHTRGSFTGAVSDHIGLFRDANNGTIFLDEIGELPINQQAKLLRVLETRKVQPVGDVNEYPINCRVIAATNRDLLHDVKQKKFREDLYFRLARIVLLLKGLQDRPGDAEAIARAIIYREDWTPLEDKIDPAVYELGGVRALENWLFQRELSL
jgi:transcriptional regulator with PAS, ATPase and Fis domain